MDDDEFVVRPRCADDPADLGPQGYVIVAFKAHQVSAAAESMRLLLGKDNAIVTESSYRQLRAPRPSERTVMRDFLADWKRWSGTERAAALTAAALYPIVAALLIAAL